MIKFQHLLLSMRFPFLQHTHTALFCCFILLGMYQNTWAQISITPSDLPQIGTNLWTKTQALPQNINAGIADALTAQIWDFSSLQSPTLNKVMFVANENAAQSPFPAATFKRSGSIASLLGFEFDFGTGGFALPDADAYYSKDAQGNVRIEGLWFDTSQFGIGQESIVIDSDPAYRFWSVGSLNDQWQSEAEMVARIYFDSAYYQIKIDLQNQSQIDAFGTLTLPNSSPTEVLRYNEDIEAHITTGVFVELIPGFPIPVPEELIQNIIPLPYLDTLVYVQSLRFWAKDEGYPLATLNYQKTDSTSNLLSVEYIYQAPPASAAFTYTANEEYCYEIYFNAEENNTEEVQYQWAFGDGSGSQQMNPSHIYTANGDYEVTLIVENLSGERDTLQQIIQLDCITDGINNIAGGQAAFGIAQNPVYQQLHLQNVEAGTLEIGDMQGKTWYHIPVENAAHWQYDISGLPVGLYRITLHRPKQAPAASSSLLFYKN